MTANTVRSSGYSPRPHSRSSVDVDIDPGIATSPMNLKSRGVIPMPILTTTAFDSPTVDSLTVMFGPAGATDTHRRGHLEDEYFDGDIDLLLHFAMQATGTNACDIEAHLTGLRRSNHRRV